MGTKKCSRCGVEKPLDCFNSKKTRKDGKQSECKECRRAYADAYYPKKKEKSKIYAAKKYAENPEKYRARARKNAKKSAANLSDRYVSSLLSMPVSECPPELIELKREQLCIHRLTKQLKEEFQNV